MSRYDDKTEQPTARRRREARREGQVAKSQELPVAMSLVALATVAAAVAPVAGRTLLEQTTRVLGSADHGFQAPLRTAIEEIVLTILVPFAIAAAVAAAAAQIAQVGFHLAPKAARPSLRNLNPKKGLERFKPSVAGWELVKSLLKLGLLGAVVWGPASQAVDAMLTADGLGPMLSATAAGLWSVVLRAALLAGAVAAADYGVNRYRHQRKLKMSRREVRDELRQSEGDPLVRQQRRRRQQEMSRNRMIREVGTADVVVTNPTHLAVALRYRPPDPAPRVVAKGAGKTAARIRRDARRHGVPVLEDRPLARALFRRAKVGGFVPAALYEAAAVVLAAAYRRTGRKVA